MKLSGIRPYVIPGIAGLIFTALYVPVFIQLVSIWLNDPYYSHGLLVLPVSLLIAWTKRRSLRKSPPSSIGVIVFSAGLACYVAGFIWDIFWLWSLSFIIVIAGIVLYIGGRNVFQKLVFPLAFLIFMIPFPLPELIGIPFQNIAAYSSVWIVQVFGIPITRTGMDVMLPNAVFTIGIPCSGMNTLISLLALSSLLLYILKSSFRNKLILFIIAVPLSILANIIRLSILFVIAHVWGADTAMTYFHDYSSLVLFLLAVGFLLILSRLMGCRIKSFSELAHDA